MKIIITEGQFIEFDKILKENTLNEIKSDEVDMSSFEVKKTLHPKFWSENMNLSRKVRLRLLKIADDFLESINIKSDLVDDYLLLGSLANYNWSKYSDIDLHILIDFKKINKDIDLVEEYFNSKKKLWNEEHGSLKIYGFPIEIYIQNIDEDNASAGVFSLEKNKWIKKPSPIDENIIDRKKIQIKASDLINDIEDLEKKYRKNLEIDEIEIISKKVKSIYDKIKRLRNSGLSTKKGEFSNGNIIFKLLRRTGYISKLIDLKRETYDKINTLK